jgi:lipopolysaccharide transport system ATP-binding protein
MSQYSHLPTIFHLTHWKAGSQWIYGILDAVASERIVPPQSNGEQFTDQPVVPGGIYPTLYLTRQQFETVTIPENSIKFVIIRDIRDTLISRYFSIKVSHPIVDETGRHHPRVSKNRDVVAQLSLEDGLRYVMDMMKNVAAIQTSWLNSGELMIRYEDLVADEYSQLNKLIEYCQIEVDHTWFQDVIRYNSFEGRTGRNKGEEDVQSHFRKGIVGDWQNYFTDAIKAEFKELYGDVLIKTGYETGSDW